MALRKVKIRNTPNIKTQGLGVSGNMIYPIYKPNMMATPDIDYNRSLGPVDREDANLEAEKGETAFIPNVQGLPAHFDIGGERHFNGGTPLNLPDDSFIFSDTSKMKLGGDLVKDFGKNPDKKYTPADIAKQYDINRYRAVLADPATDAMQKKTAEMMISNYNLKLGKLGLVQEAKKGFPQGIPAVSIPYLIHASIDPSQILPPVGGQQQGPQDQQMPENQQQMRMGGHPQPWANFGNALMQDGGYKSQADYEAHLLDPYSATKRQAQAEWYAKQRVQQKPQQPAKTKQTKSEPFDFNKVKEHLNELEARKNEEYRKMSQDQMEASAAKNQDRLDAERTRLVNQIQDLQKQGKYTSNWNFLPSFLEPTTVETQMRALEKNDKRYGINTEDPSNYINSNGPFNTSVDSAAVAQKYMQSHQAQPVAKDTVRGLSVEEQRKLLGLKNGGLIKAQEGITMKNGKLYVTKNGVVAEITDPKIIKDYQQAHQQKPTTAKPSSTDPHKDVNQLYRNDYLDNLNKLQGTSNMQARLPKKEFMSDVPKMQNADYTKNFWNDPAKQEDFKQRHAWFFKENPDWKPYDDNGNIISGATKKFHDAYNAYGKQKGMKEDYFTSNDSDKHWRNDDMWGQGTFSAPALDPQATTLQGKQESEEDPRTPQSNQTKSQYTPEEYHNPAKPEFFKLLVRARLELSKFSLVLVTLS